MSQPLVEAVDASRVYGNNGNRVMALQHATMRVNPGDRIALVGPSGSGKSTLLHLLAGLDEPTTGDVRWPALGRRDQLRPTSVAFVFQNESLLAPLTVLENIELPCLLAGAPPERARADALAMLSAMELGALGDKLPEEISGGQAQRVAVARALTVQPRLILADEPTGQLDHPTASHLLDLIDRSLAGSDTALVVATHDPAVARRMTTQWSMNHGVLR